MVDVGDDIDSDIVGVSVRSSFCIDIVLPFLGDDVEPLFIAAEAASAFDT